MTPVAKSESKFKVRLVTGLLASLPFLLSFWVVRFVLSFLSELSHPLLVWFLSVTLSPESRADLVKWEFWLSLPLTVSLGFLLFYLMGYFAERGWKTILDRVFLKLPFVRSVYNSALQLIDVLGPKKTKEKGLFDRLCLIKLKDEVEILGFLTSEFIDQNQQELSTVYVPMPPNPTAGLIYVVKKSQLRFISLPQDQTMKLIMSGGLLTPSHLDIR